MDIAVSHSSEAMSDSRSARRSAKVTTIRSKVASPLNGAIDCNHCLICSNERMMTAAYAAALQRRLLLFWEQQLRSSIRCYSWFEGISNGANSHWLVSTYSRCLTVPKQRDWGYCLNCHCQRRGYSIWHSVAVGAKIAAKTTNYCCGSFDVVAAESIIMRILAAKVADY